VELGDRAELSFEDAAAQFRDLFLASLNMHLQSDVPVGIALSGGLDSSSITGGVRAVMAGGFQIHAFSYLPDDIRISEEEWIDLIGRAVGAVVHKVHLSGKELIADIDHLIEIMGEPFRDTRIYAQYRVFRLAREAGMKVIIDGQGGDELLGGYREFLTARLLRSRRLESRPKPPPAWINDGWFLDRGAEIAEAEDDSQDERTLRVLLWRSLAETILPSLLRHGDRNAMYFSLENRVPFLTPDLVKFVLRLPDQYIIGPDRTSKALLRKAMRGLVPDGILDRSTKVPFTTPELQWLKELSPWVDKTLGGTMAHDIPVLRHARLVREWELRRVGERPYDARVWRWLNLISWAEKVEASFD
jgi:asparagine synthase (glutamine-hydrolysing)